MAVQNYFTNYNTAGYNPTQDNQGVPENWALQQSGVKMRYAQQTITIAAGDSNGSTYLLMKDLPADAILLRCDLEIDAGASNTSASIGLYNSSTGVAVAANGYMNAVSVASATTPALGSMVDGCQALTHEARLVPAYSVAGDTLLTKKGKYDLVLTLNTGTSAASITAHMQIVDNG